MILFKVKRETGRPLLSVASLRLKKDMEELASKRYLAGYTNVNISIPYIDDIYICVPVVFHVKSDCDSPYSNANFNTIIKVSSNYPFKPPEMFVLNKVYHPNVDLDTGAVHMRALQEHEWKPVLTLNSIIFAFETLLNEPDVDLVPCNPINTDMIHVYITDYEKFYERVRWTMNGGVFLEKYVFEYNYGEFKNRRRIRNENCMSTKRHRYYGDGKGMSAEIELKYN
ncbi:hypothetical protein SteCoe_22254 [Stentor coeruleus]|uniref:UBC core domain-containing protein n=1 Tax=Stentor coeruleus TaxID=5963 RepID=A0A1R2BMP7_9CILI|nr:hypothetical protein SteCoe_22254 [Stentor coeruleus]